MAKKKGSGIVAFERVQAAIIVLRGQRVILDADLARLYGVTPKRLNEQVRRNSERFPADFMFELTRDEVASLRSQIATLDDQGDERSLRSQIVTSRRGRHSKYLPHAFTEHGAIMAATVLNSKEAVKASLFVVRAFVQLREMLSTHRELAVKLDELERRLQKHDDEILALFEAIRQMMQGEDEGTEEAKPPIGFQTEIAGQNSRIRAGKRLPGKASRARKME
jgi:hypothetical protein